MFAILSSKRSYAPSAAALAVAAIPTRSATAWADPLPLPEVVEDDSDAAWALWQATVRGQSSQEADTVLMDLPAY
jgi:hypothetical protein